ncbi:hypothetical protein HU200_004748 [Digitaria exilis]|uniref:Poly(A) RNA polymerase mitochondrial-like central palm domain-containing protein n=1 Tax=Digitaria exilis TaxID=1010633 RepID=A0A835FUI1_9POAL|nr:hypothetical protein HU200_004748 [Digitaria exilis]
MIEYVHSCELLKACIEDILSTIKPGEDDQKKRLCAIQELEDIYSSGTLRGAVVKPFGSFVSNLYAKSGDLDVSVDLWSSPRISISKKKKQNALRELMRALQIRGVAKYMDFIPTARVPIIHYMSNRFGISCDISINNYPGRIKARIFYWINTIDERFGDMVLLVKEWAKTQNINDPKHGTLNSYSLCLLIIFYFQRCKPAILPPLKEIYDGNVAKETVFYDEKHVDEVCAANIARFISQNMGQRNRTSLSHLFLSFFDEFFGIRSLSSTVISTYTGQFERIPDNPSWMAKSYSFFVEDPFERPDNAARAVDVEGLERIEHAFNHTSSRLYRGALNYRSELVSLLCTPAVGSLLRREVGANCHANTLRSHQLYSPAAANLYDNQHHQQTRDSWGSRSSSQSQGYVTGHQIPRPDHHYYKQPQAYSAEGRTAGQVRNVCRPEAYTAGLRTAVPLKYNDYPQPHATGSRTVGRYQNQQRRKEYSPY